ncbi:hypothetical protein NNJEOMEG_02129 [Fundidesulfovibrio magnetotacticus]|uniref:Saposin B-type domain-containing protein n=1 Tax=Fundidesulfovibrio magnetotacticus TaxID=2730080 RepID=A0A6V8LXA8_9BACT|nr:saposin domain-containing protein [Fundidesulfovibrio magnetotacticus]GFK94287.1 hypothetical protein NNJEOMEG_02129 [Fundidesulfovibrio magnetotacticus]
MKRAFPMFPLALALAAALVLTGESARAQGGYLECTACQLVLGLVQASMGDADALAVDASRQCSLLAPADRAACEAFYASMGPKFLKAFRERLKKGETLEGVCRAMSYCR